MIKEVKPVIIRPVSIVHLLCLKPYPNHKQGCPNYGKRKTCPPYVQMFDSVYDLTKPIYAIYNVFNFKAHVDRMRQNHPRWSQRQLECCPYWQGTARKQLKEWIELFKSIPTIETGTHTIITAPEAMGVNVTETMKRAGVELEWPPVNVAYKIAFAAIRKERR